MPKLVCGFTLVETLVAVSVLILAVAAPLTLGSQGLTSSRIARDQVIATYFIQEAIEYIRNKRDTNILGGDGWLTGFNDCIAGTCRIDVPQDTVLTCPGGTCIPFNYNSQSGLYGYTTGSNWTASKFTRGITIQQTVNNVEAKIIVTVTWQDGLMTRSVSADEYLMNWQ